LTTIYFKKIIFGKKALISSVSTSIVIIIIACFVLLQQFSNADYPNTNQVKIKTFSAGNSWENPGGLEVTLPFNLTIQNTGTNDLQGLKIVVEMFESDSSVSVETFVGEDEQFNGVLLEGEVREIKGLIGTTIEATSAMLPIGGTSEAFTYLAKVRLGDVVLDEYWTTYYVNAVIEIDGTVNSATAPIQHFGDTYILTGDMGSLEVKRSNIILDSG